MYVIRTYVAVLGRHYSVAYFNCHTTKCCSTELPLKAGLINAAYMAFAFFCLTYASLKSGLVR